MSWKVDPTSSVPRNSSLSESSLYQRICHWFGRSWKTVSDPSVKEIEKSPVTSVFESRAPKLNQKENDVEEFLKDFEVIAPEFVEADLFIEDPILMAAKADISRAQKLLTEMDQMIPLSIQEYMQAIEQVDRMFEEIKGFASQFVNTSPKNHQLVQKTMRDLSNKMDRLEEEMCEQVQASLKPNPAIGDDGHCLFRSIDDQLSGSQDQHRTYREQAAHYIRENSEQFKESISDIFENVVQGQRVLTEYQEKQGGDKEWQKKLQEKLQREPTLVDFYCDCLENTTLWGGQNELMALSIHLKTPIFVFTQNNQQWRFDLKLGEKEFKNTPPILLYYNGANHYQSLISRYGN